jgi:RNA polymerase sigma-70 factor (ECF subfamily)
MRFIKSGRKSDKSDEAIISAYKESRDNFYIGILFDRYNHLVFAVSMKYLKNEEDSKDTVIRIFEKLPGDLLRYTIQNFSSGLHTVTKNDCLRFLSGKKNHSGFVENIPEPPVEEEDDFITRYLPRLDHALSTLNEQQRVCIDLFYLQNMSYEEVSEKTGYTMNQVKSYIQNGKRNLKILLSKKTNGDS